MPPRPRRKAPPPAPLTPGLRAEQAARAIDALPSLVLALLVMHIAFLFVVVLSMTMLTLSLDDIKKTIYFVAGPILAFVALLAYALRQAPVPPRGVRWGLIGFAIALFLSALNAEFKWIGWHEALVYYSSIGFMLSAAVIGSWRRASEPFIRFFVLQLLVTTIIGSILYDFFENDPNIGSIVGWIYQNIYRGEELSTANSLQTLLYTFVQSDGAMQSTILNRDFYAGFILLYLPYAMLTMLDPGTGRRARVWQAIGGVATVLGIVCVIKAQSKGEYLVGAVTTVLFLGAFFAIGGRHLAYLRKRVMAAVVIGFVVLVASILWIMSPMLMSKLKTLDVSIESRSIIWGGSVRVFKEHPILGGGPGSFRIYYPRFQRPDYYLHEIANVTPESHNYFLDLLSELGILGFSTYAVMAGTALWLAFLLILHARLSSRMRVCLLAALVGMMGIYGANISSPMARWVIGASSMWTGLGFLVGLVVQARRQELIQAGNQDALLPASAEPEVHPLWQQWRGTCFGIVLFGAAIIPFLGAKEGIDYFKSRVAHLDGYRLMQYGLNWLGPNAGPREIRQGEAIFEMSIAQFAQSTKHDPFNNQSLYQVGSVFTTLSNVEMSRLRSAASQLGVDRSLVATQAERVNMRLRQARDAYEKLQAFWPDYAEINYNLAQIYRTIASTTQEFEMMGLESSFRKEHTPAEWMHLAVRHAETQRRMSNKESVASLVGNVKWELKQIDGDIRPLTDFYRNFIDGYPADEAGFRAHYQSMLNDVKIRRHPDAETLVASLEQVLREAQSIAMQVGDGPLHTAALDRLSIIRPLDDQILEQLLVIGTTDNQDDLVLRTLDRLEALNPVDQRIPQFRMMLAWKHGDTDAALIQFDRYLKSGGRDPQIIAGAREEAETRGVADRFNQLLQQHGATVPAG